MARVSSGPFEIVLIKERERPDMTTEDEVTRYRWQAFSDKFLIESMRGKSRARSAMNEARRFLAQMDFEEA